MPLKTAQMSIREAANALRALLVSHTTHARAAHAANLRANTKTTWLDPMVVRLAPLKRAANTVNTVPNDATGSI